MVVTAKAPDTTRVRWREAWRIIASRYPPIALFERVSDDPAVRDVLTDLEQATNPRLRDEAGEIALVPPEDAADGEEDERRGEAARLAVGLPQRVGLIT